MPTPPAKSKQTLEQGPTSAASASLFQHFGSFEIDLLVQLSDNTVYTLIRSACEGSVFHHLCQSRVRPFPVGWGYDRDTMEEPICLQESEVKAKCKNPYCNPDSSTITAAFRIKLRENLPQSGLLRQIHKSNIPFYVSGEGKEKKNQHNIGYYCCQQKQQT